MKTVLHVITGLGTGGAEMMLLKLIESTDPKKTKNVVVALTDYSQTMRARITKTKTAVYRLKVNRGEMPLWAINELRQLIQRTKPDIVHCWMYHANIVGLLASLICGVRRVIWNIRASDFDLAGVHKSLQGVFDIHSVLASFPSVLVANSYSGHYFHAARGHKARRWTVIQNSFDLERFKPSTCDRNLVRTHLGLAGSDIVVGHVARFSPMKNHLGFLSAITPLLSQFENLRVVMAGTNVTWDNKELSAALSNPAMQNRVRLLGERQDTSRMMAALDIFALSSNFGEGFPNVLGEAMATEVPCVTTDVGDAKKIVGDTGIVCPVNNTNALTESLRIMLSKSALERAALGKAARQSIVDRFSNASIQAQYENLYDSLS